MEYITWKRKAKIRISLVLSVTSNQKYTVTLYGTSRQCRNN